MLKAMLYHEKLEPIGLKGDAGPPMADLLSVRFKSRYSSNISPKQCLAAIFIFSSGT